MTINYGILGGQFHFEVKSSESGGRFGCYGQPDRETTFYVANANGYQTLTLNQFEHVAHLFPQSCAANLIHKSAKLVAPQGNQRMAKSIQVNIKDSSDDQKCILV